MKDLKLDVSLAHGQRMAIADLLPQFIDRLKLDAKGQSKISFRLSELKAILWSAGEEVSLAGSGKHRNALRRIIASFQKTIREAHEIGAIPPSKRLYQFKITLLGIKPTIWRRIQVQDCSFDRLHECIQSAMGWTNSHSHQFEILGIVYGDPELLCENPEGFVGVDSRVTKIGAVVPRSGVRFPFSYEYDFGDRWKHGVLFEGCLESEQGVRYPRCLEGERACPPEDVGGDSGYKEFLVAIADPAHEEHEEWKQWAGGNFDPEHFDPLCATRTMQQPFFDWRQLASRT